MEAIWDKLAEHGLVVAFMGVVIYFIWREYKFEKKEKMKAYQLIIDLLKEKDK